MAGYQIRLFTHRAGHPKITVFSSRCKERIHCSYHSITAYFITHAASSHWWVGQSVASVTVCVCVL